MTAASAQIIRVLLDEVVSLINGDDRGSPPVLLMPAMKHSTSTVSALATGTLKIGDRFSLAFRFGVAGTVEMSAATGFYG